MSFAEVRGAALAGLLMAVSACGAARVHTYETRIPAGGPRYSFRLVGEPADGSVLAVRRIEIRRDGDREPFQSIDDLRTETPLETGAGFQVVDMNFDGYDDFRLMEFAAAGPTTPYVNYLFDPATSRFVRSAALDELPSATFDAARRRIVSTWRDGATRYGRDEYAFRGAVPALVRREVRDYESEDAYVLTVSEAVGGEMVVVETRRVGP
jgi:hypothetical protein